MYQLKQFILYSVLFASPPTINILIKHQNQAPKIITASWEKVKLNGSTSTNSKPINSQQQILGEWNLDWRQAVKECTA